MSFNIFWSSEAELSYLNILKYLNQKWSEKELSNFIQRTDEVLDYITQNPYLYQQVKDNTFKAVVTTQIALFYKVQESEIYLHLFWDTRQNPDKLNF